MNEQNHDFDQPEMPQPCDEWHQLHVAAAAAGRWAAQRLASRCSARQLGRRERVDALVEPADSPIAAWLLRTGRGVLSETELAVVVPIVLTTDDLGAVRGALDKASSLLVRRAYAAAYCTVLAEEAGVATEIRIDFTPTSPAPLSNVGTRTELRRDHHRPDQQRDAGQSVSMGPRGAAHARSGA